MKTIIYAVAAGLVFAAAAALAQAQQQTQESVPPKIGMGSKTMESCREDTRKYCADAPDRLQKECLVKHWTEIASDCQDALGTPGRY